MCFSFELVTIELPYKLIPLVSCLHKKLKLDVPSGDSKSQSINVIYSQLPLYLATLHRRLLDIILLYE
jgi:hypothetical protein